MQVLQRHATGRGMAWVVMITSLGIGLVWPSWGQTAGALTQLAGLDGCISETGSGPCTDGRGLDSPFLLTVSPDGKHVYVASQESSAIAVFARNKTTGALTQLAGLDGCISETGSGPCTDGRGLDHAVAVAVSPDGKHVYVASYFSNAVAVFARNKTTGALTQLAGLDGCISETGGGPCTDGRGLFGARSVAVSPDGKHVYVIGEASNAIAVFTRNKTTGALTQLEGLDGCVSEDGTGPCTDGIGLLATSAVTVSPDGKHVYVASHGSSAIAAFARNKKTGVLTQLAGLDGCVSEDGTGPCTDGIGLNLVVLVTVSKDGKHVYAASYNSGAVAVFARNKKTGVLTQLAGLDGCVSEDGTGPCTDGTGLSGAVSVTVSKDGKHVYVASYLSNAVAAFTRNKTTGTLAQLTGFDGCISETGSGPCTDGTGLIGAYSVAVSPDGKHVYVASRESDSVAVFVRDK